MIEVTLTEWQTLKPETTPELRDIRLPESDETRALLGRLAERQMLVVRELRSGVEVAATSFVGAVAVGPLAVRIRPKLRSDAFATLVGYALGLPHIELLPEQDAPLTPSGLQDLVIGRLASEAARLLARGIHRHYLPQESALDSPRGRIMFSALARQHRSESVTVPCRFHQRDENVLPNRVLLAGLQLGARLAVDARVRRHTVRTVLALREQVEPITLDAATMRSLERASNRMLERYAPAFALIRLLMAGHGISVDSSVDSFPLPGFLFDMNLLFQQAIGRFLRESLEDVRVDEQHPLRDLFAYQSQFNPRGKRAPTPRPDYVFLREGRIVGIADAKYRDLWERDLGRDMLYQLTIYALSQSHCRSAAILYPGRDPLATEARVSIHNPITGQVTGEVHLRPVNIDDLGRLVRRGHDTASERARTDYARRLAFGAGAAKVPDGSDARRSVGITGAGRAG